jgi:hypothetical protein
MVNACIADGASPHRLKPGAPAPQSKVGVHMSSLPPLPGGFVGHTHLFGVVAELHVGNMPQHRTECHTPSI